jgi:TolB-like protein/Tfp pilus assembly protein PilF
LQSADPMSDEPESPTAELRKARKKKAKVRSVWISFGGRVVAQIVGAMASVTLGIFVVGKYKFAEKASVKDTATVEQAAHLSRHKKDRPSGELALAVLPLQNYSADAKNAYFADGVTEALITDLAQIKGLRVTSRTSSMAYKDSTKPLPEISRELGVDLVLEGSIVRDEKRVRVTAQLIDADTDEHLWARSYDRAVRDVLSLQAEVATAIAKEVNVTVAPRLELRFARRKPMDPAVFDTYLEGVEAWRTRTPQGLQVAVQKFSDVIGREPDFAPAHASLADTYGLLGLQPYRDVAPPDAVARARVSAERAVALDDGLAEAHGTLAWLRHFYDWDWPGAEKEYRRALELNPGYATGHMRYAVYLADVGRAKESAIEAARAVELDPLSATVYRATGMAHYLSRRFDQAAAAERRSLEIDPGNPSSALILCWTFLAAHEPRKALAVFEGLQAPPSEQERIQSMIAIALNRAGDRGPAAAAKAALLSVPGVSADALLRLHAGTGDTTAAFAALDKAITDRLDIVTGLKVDPLFDSLRADPRFHSLQARVGLP